MIRFFAICAVITNVSIAVAVDVPFGADALPFNVLKATLVIQAKSAKALPEPERSPDGQAAYNYYQCSVGRVLKGMAEVESLTFAVAKSLDLKSPDEYAGRFLFLEQVRNAEERQRFPVSGDAPVYRLVVGRLSAIDVSNGNRMDAITNYLKVVKEEPPSDAPKPPLSENRAAWCSEYMAGDDPFLQRSVVLELHRYSYDSKAVKMLGDIVKRESTKHELKRDAVNALQASGSIEAVAPLKVVAEDAKLPSLLRSHAVKAVGSLPGGQNELKKWSEGSDGLLQRSSKKEFDRVNREK